MTSLVSGDVGGGFQIPRLIIVALIPLFVKDISTSTIFKKTYLYEIAFSFFWIIWGVITLPFAIDLSFSVKQIIYLVVHLIGFIEVLWLARKASNPQEAIIVGWLLAFIISLPIAIWELTTNNHLAYLGDVDMGTETYHVMTDGERIARPFANITFSNLNTYNTLLCYILQFVVAYILYMKKNIKWLIGGLYIIAIAVMIFVNSSRMAVICLGCTLVMLLLTQLRHPRTILLTILIGASIVWLLTTYSDLSAIVVNRLTNESDEADPRVEIIMCCLQEIKDTFGFGCGIGNINPLLEQKYQLQYCAPHNLWLEIASQYGLIVFLGFMELLLRIFRRGIRGTRFNRTIVWIGLIVLVPISVINSGYLSFAMTFMYLASIYVLSNPIYNREAYLPPSRQDGTKSRTETFQTPIDTETK